jgi:hypothetical protein
MRKTLVAASLVAALGCGGSGTNTAPPAGSSSTLTFLVTRSATSQIPAAAESAFVKLFSNDTDVVQPILLPTGNDSTHVTFTVPAGTGYSIEVVAFHELHDGIRVALAGGEIHSVTLVPGANTVSLSVAPWTYTLAGPDTIQSGVPATYTHVITGGPTDLFTGIVEIHSRLGATAADDHFNVTGNGTTTAATFNIPALATDSALYFAYSPFIDDARFHTHSLSFAADMPFGTLPPFIRPIKAAAAQVVVSFRKHK